MSNGYSIRWPALMSPYFAKPDGKNIICDVHSHVPYVRRREPTREERSVDGGGPQAAVPLRCLRFASDPVLAGGGTAPHLRV